MAEENILLRVGIDQNQIKQSEQAIITARTEIDRLKEANKELEKQGQKNSIQFVKNQTDIKDLSNEVRENERVLQANAKMSRSAGGSIAELRESVKTLQAEYVNLSKEERENEKVGGELQKRIKAQNDELKNLEKQIGVTGRNVGNYKEEIQSALAEAGLFNKAQAVMATVQNTVSAATKVATIATKSFGAALIATGIGAIVVVLGSLFAALTKTQKGMDLVAQATSAVGTFVAKVTDAFSKLGEQILKAVIPTFTSLSDIIGGILKLDFDQVKKGINGVAKAVGGIEPINLLEVGKNAIQSASDAQKLTKELQNLTREEKQLDLQRAQSRQNIEALKLIAEDQTKSIEERAKAAQDALNIELGLEQKAIKLQENKIKIIAAQNELSNSTDEDNNRLIDAQIELANLQQESGTKQIELNNKLNALRKQNSAEAIKETKEIATVAEEVAIDVNKAFTEKLKEQSKQTELSIRENINKLKQEFIAGVITYKEYQDQLNAVEVTALETRRALLEEQRILNQEDDLIDNELKVQNEIKLQDQLRALEDESLNLSIKAQQDFLKAKKDADAEIVASAKAREQAEIDAIQNVLSIAISAFGASSAAGKIAASFQVLVDTFVSARRAFNSQLIPGDPTSPARAAIAAAAVSAQGLAQVAKINAKAPPKFADGGGIEVSGPSHAGGGVDVALGGQTVANVEGGEGLFVMKKDAYQSLKSLSNYNQMFGGNSWFGGGKKFLADGGAISRGSTPTIDRRMLQDTQSSISNAMQSINVITKVTDINRVSNEMKIVEMQGDLR